MTALILSLCFALSASDSAPAIVTRLDGKTAEGVLSSWAGDVLRLQVSGEELFLQAEDLLSIRWARTGDQKSKADEGIMLALVDGSRLKVSSFVSTGGDPRVATVNCPLSKKPLRIDASLIRAVEFQARKDADADAWREFESDNSAGDILLVAKKEGEPLDSLAGAVREVTQDQIKFDWDGDAVAVKRSKVAAIGYYTPKPPHLGDPVCDLALTDGSHIRASWVALHDEKLLVKMLAGGFNLELPLSSLESADFSAGKLAYLSDLKPLSVSWTPRIALPKSAEVLAAAGLPRNNQSFSGSALSLLWNNGAAPADRDVRTYAKGLALRSRTELVYRLPDGMRRFVAIAGIDPETTRQGDVELEVLADDRLLWQGEIDGKSLPAELNLELGSAHRLQIRVDYGKNLDYGDRLHLAEARVTK